MEKEPQRWERLWTINLISVNLERELDELVYCLARIKKRKKLYRNEIEKERIVGIYEEEREMKERNEEMDE